MIPTNLRTPAWLLVPLLAAFAGLPAFSAISINVTGPGREVSPYLFGSQLAVWGAGSGAIQNDWGRIRQPTSFSPYLIDVARDMKLSTLRYCGDIYYDWRTGVGPHHKRPGFRTYHLNNRVDWSAYGVDEFIALCRVIGAEPVIQAPFLVCDADSVASDSPIADQMSANFVEYCNGISPGLAYGQSRGWEPTVYSNPPDAHPDWTNNIVYTVGQKVVQKQAVFQCKIAHTSTTATQPGTGADWTSKWTLLVRRELTKPGKSWKAHEKAPAGYFAWLREYFGNKDPYGVKFWEIGNEVWAWDSNIFARSSEYGKLAVRIIDKMKEVDPTIHCGLSLPGPQPAIRHMYHRTVLGQPGSFTEAWQKADFFIWHLALGPAEPNLADPAAEYTALFDAVHWIENYQRTFVNDYHKPVWVTEYNTNYRTWHSSDPNVVVNQNKLKSGLAMAILLNQLARVGVTGAHQLALGDFGKWYPTTGLRMVFEDRDPVTGDPRKGVTPTYQALWIFSRYARGTVYEVTAGDHPSLDVAAYLSTEGKLRIFAINKSHTTSVTAPIQLTGFIPLASARVLTLNSALGMEAGNEIVPNSVNITETSIDGAAAQFNYTFPAHSLTMLELDPAAGSAGDPDVQNLTLTTSVSKTDPKPGDELLYEIICQNTGLHSIAQANVHFQMPVEVEYLAGTATMSGSYNAAARRIDWALQGMAPGQSRTLQFRGRVK